MIESKLNGESKDILEENINKLKELFPEILTEDKIDFEKLKLLLTDKIDDSPERYNFTWNGKSKAIAEAQKPSTGTLRPCKEESEDWDTTQNLYLEGDNLEVLKLLQKPYYNKIKMIYIDPPYNTGKDFIYPDNYKDNLENYLERTGQVASNTELGERERAMALN
jgi:adenine-specific DNA-methyltransferase